MNCETGLWDDNITDENRANDLIWFNLKSNESLVYGRPKYLSELDAILTDNAIIEYQQGHFKAHGIPNYIITVTGNVEEKKIILLMILKRIWNMSFVKCPMSLELL